MSVQNKFGIGDKVKYVGSGWGETFKRDIEYPVTDIWYSGCDVDGNPVSNRYYNDFELVKDTPKAQDNSWYENGELPPIGANIEYKIGAGPWFEATVKYVLDVLDGEEDEIVIACPHLGFEQLLTLNKHNKIRPTTTPEQIAKQEREDYCDRIYSVLCKAERKNNRSDMAESLYDAGLRFVVEGVQHGN